MEAQKASSVLPAHERANPPPMPQPTAPGNKAPAAPARERPYKSAPEDTDLSVLGAKDSSTGIRDSASPVSGGRTEAPKEKIDANHAPKTPAAEAAEPVTSRAKEQGPSEKPPPASPPAAQEKLVVYFLHNASGLDRRSMETLELAAGLLQNNPRLNVQVIGYTDSLGDPRYNLRLSKRRADIVGSYLRRKGVDPGRIHSIGLGSSNPMMPNRTQEGRAQNRRVEILFDSGYE
jgi:outer membrane protein OmpA-like peptidoglycan-associated protein